jgi:hypothetical protein
MATIATAQSETDLVSYAESWPEFQDGDLLLYRPLRWDVIGWLIARSGMGEFCHAAMVARDLMPLVLEVTRRGGRESSLKSQVWQWPGRIVWYRICIPEYSDFGYKWYDRTAMVARMRQFIGTKYGWWRLLGTAIRHALLMRILLPVPKDDEADRYPPFCSEAVSIAVRAGGVDPVPGLGDRVTEPADLARSMFWRRAGRLVP